jgi:NADH-quinone oxidoreductase subunit L
MKPFNALSRFLARVVDPLGVDGLVNGAGRLVGFGGRELRQSQTGYLRSYTMVFLVGAIAVLGYFGYAALQGTR